ncbi:unnamed protein product [Microthlaspi erraticum]|uniref:DUF295 domain-containing protein n=1 Tax=Microthlaspi erraticum TaxID=1685480 RepID=A0A6D2KAI1_9BRAS|nr:unnamed protein product [Microthlaspi erraticum]
MEKMITRAVMVFRLDGEGNAVYTEDIGDLRIFISNSKPFCVPPSSFQAWSLTSSNSSMWTNSEGSVSSVLLSLLEVENLISLTRFHPKR